MANQNTIKNEFELWGIEPYGGNRVRVTISPAEEDSGIVFSTSKGDLKAELSKASQYKSAILLADENNEVLHIEHLLATLFAYGIDNARVSLEREASRSYRWLDSMGFATDIDVVPNFEGETYGLCEKLDGNLQEQESPRNLLTFDQTIGDLESDRITIEDNVNSGLIVAATTRYPILGEQSLSIQVDGKTYKEEIARSRPYSKHLKRLPVWVRSCAAAIMNPSFGLGHGFDPEENVLLPIRNKGDLYRARRHYAAGDEPVRHTIMDRLGALALLPGRLEDVKVTAQFSGHANDIAFLSHALTYLKTNKG